MQTSSNSASKHTGFAESSDRKRKNSSKPILEECLDMEMVWRGLPHLLVDKIISMVPFPEILKARLFNKSWNSNFSTLSGFQKQIVAYSSSWNQYCPVVLSHNREWLMGFDHSGKQWLKFRTGTSTRELSNHIEAGAGSLICGFDKHNNIFVTNVITKTWKLLPPRLYDIEDLIKKASATFVRTHLVAVGSEAYQVLHVSMFCNDNHGNGPLHVWCELYDSRTSLWTTKHSMLHISSLIMFYCRTVYFNGILYVMYFKHGVVKVFLYNVVDATWTTFPNTYSFDDGYYTSYDLLVCQSCVMMVVPVHAPASRSDLIPNTLHTMNTYIVYRLDPVSLDIREVSRGPPNQSYPTVVPQVSSVPIFITIVMLASDTERIYFREMGKGWSENNGRSLFLVFNARTCEWSYQSVTHTWLLSFGGPPFPIYPKLLFQPGLNPFVSV